MFNSSQEQFLNPFLSTLYNDGYYYYVAYTHFYSNGWGYDTEPDLYILVSKDKITSSDGYVYHVSNNSKLYSVRTYGYSSSAGSNNSNRVNVTNYSGRLSVDRYEHIYTNSIFANSIMQPDLLRKDKAYEKDYFFSFSTIIASFLLVFCFFKMWQIRK